MGALEAQGGNTSTDPIHMWLARGLTLTDEGWLVNPLKWWMRQRHAGNTHGGLLQMALDVLSCPGEFSTSEKWIQQQSMLSNRSALGETMLPSKGTISSVTRGMAVAFYLKNGKIKLGLLSKWKANKSTENKHKGKGKAAKR
ncbi:hypothetical protein PSTG_13697 [Puccinia striiformis f. sp. tritici PST-78]|uniref:HAT C-terminal dimerisation domain-containing protein n=1 Tax=Puccinia striiformis f. sp. tritici PST-78 TaxID=1165861 RepID=A0A0L0V1M6_9BASI|nr:hypothetical protein PSTG_13697 [Puccinia striiformis f. sp. tritici PST-78]